MNQGANAVDRLRDERRREPDEHRRGPDNHLALVYETFDEQMAAVIPFVRQGLDRGERVLYVLDENTESDLVEALRSAGVDVDAARDSGALTFQAKADFYERGDQFDPVDMIDLVEETVQETLSEGRYDRVRVTGEMTWALDGDVDTLDALVEYESTLNDFFPDMPVTGLCQYHREAFPPSLLYDIIRAHPHQVYNATVCQNFAYLPPEEFFATDTPSVEADHFIDTHLDRIRARGRLQQREEDLAALAASSQRLLSGDDADVVEDAVETVRDALEPSVVAFFRYDESIDDLNPETVAAGGESHDPSSVTIPEQYRELLWESFVSEEPNVFEHVQSGTELVELGAVLQSGFAIPIDAYGVLFVASSKAYAFDEVDVQFARTVAATAEAAFQRLERERTLEEQNEQLRYLSRLNRLIRSIDQALIKSSTRAEVERTVCERLTDSDLYRFAWIGDRDPLSEQFTVRTWAGDGEQYLEDVRVRRHDVESTATVATDPDTSFEEVVNGPARTALETGQTQVVANASTETMFETWRTAALKRGFRSCISVPLVHEGTEYGVLSLYGDEPRMFVGMERQVLAELGSTIAFAVDAVETIAGLHADRKIELTLRVDDEGSWLRRLARGAGCRLSVQTVLPASDDRQRLFFSAPADAADDVRRVAEESVRAESIRHIADRDDTALFEAVLAGETIPAVVAGDGAATQRLTASTDGVELVVELPWTANPREFVESVSATYPDTEVVSIKRINQPIRALRSFEATLREELTEKQWEALEVAHRGGYFEWPRESSAEDIAETLGIAQSTFSGHLRAGQRKLFRQLFDG